MRLREDRTLPMHIDVTRTERSEIVYGKNWNKVTSAPATEGILS